MTDTPPPAPPAARRSRLARLGRLAAAGALLGGVAALLFRPSPSGPRTARGRPSHTPSVASMHEGYEVEDLPARGLAIVLGTFGTAAALLVGVVFLMIWLFTGWDRDSNAHFTAVQTATVVPPGPTLQADPVGDLDRERAGEQRALQGYAWTDAGHTAAHVPIERAMALVIGRSLDAAP